MSGGGLAYSQLTVPKDGVSQGLQFWGNMYAQRGAEKRARNEREKVRNQQALEKWQDKFNLDSKSFQGKHTGFTTYDDTIADTANYMRSEYEKYARAELEAIQSGDREDANKNFMNKNRILNDFNQIKSGDEAISELFNNYRKAVSEGTVSEASGEFESIMKSVFLDKDSAIRYRDTEDGNRELVVTGLISSDDLRGMDKDIVSNIEGMGIKKDVPFEVPFNSITDGSFTWINKVDYIGEKGLVNQISKGLGLLKEDSRSGNYIRTNKTWDNTYDTPEKQEEVRDYIRSSVDSNMVADLLTNPRFKDKLKEGMTEEEMYNVVIDGIYDDVSNSKDEEKTMKGDPTRNRTTTGTSKTKPTGSVNIIKLDKEGNTDKFDYTISMPVGNSDDTTDYKVTRFSLGGGKNGKPMTKVLEGDPEAEVLGLGLTRNGDILLQSREFIEDTYDENNPEKNINKLKSKAMGYSSVKGNYDTSYKVATEEEIANVAGQLGFNNKEELLKNLYSQTNFKTEESTASSLVPPSAQTN